jgi:site-specific recombinase XerD
VAQGTSPRTVREVLGHADLKTTSIDVQLAQETVKRERHCQHGGKPVTFSVGGGKTDKP